MKKLLTIFTSFLVLALFSATAGATAITSAQTGTWNTTTTWTGGIVPGSSDDVTIAAGHTVTLDVSPTVNNCTVAGTGTLDASTFILTVTDAFTLQSGAAFKLEGTNNALPVSGTTSLDNNSTVVFNGSQTSIASFTFGNLTWNSTANCSPSSDLIINGDLTILQGEIIGTSGRNHTIHGNVLISGGVLAGKTGSGGTTTWNIDGNVKTEIPGELDGSVGSASGDAVFNIKGNVIDNNNIDITGNANFNLNFIGTSRQFVSGNGLGDFNTQNITIDNSAGVVLSTAVNLYGPLAQGTLTLTSGIFSTSTNLTLGSKSAISRSGGSLSGTPNFSASTDVTYTGSNPITTGPELPGSAGLNNLTINCSGGVTLGSATTCNGTTFTLTSGKLTTTATNLLTLGSTTTASGGSASSFVNGPMAQTIASTSLTSLTFPIGKVTAYRPVTLAVTQGAATPTTYTAEVFNSAPVANGIPGTLGPTISTVRYWSIVGNPTTSVTSSTVQITYGADDGATDNANLRIAQGPSTGGGEWVDLGGTVTTGTITSTNALTDFSTNTVYTLANTTTGTNPLPVELTSFTALAGKNSVELAWNTATEVNNFGFDIERKTANSQQLTANNQSLISNWTKVGFVNGHGTTNAPQGYSFTDASARVGKYSYRLKQIDHNGNFVYSQTVEATVSIMPGTIWLDNNYPNPFNPSTKISFVLGTKGHATLKVYSLLGQEVATLADGEFNDGEIQTFTFDASKYSSGIYYYQLKSGNGTQIKKMMLLK